MFIETDPEKTENKLETEESGKTSVNTTPAGEAEEALESEAPANETLAPEKEPEKTPEKLEDLSNSKEDAKRLYKQINKQEMHSKITPLFYCPKILYKSDFTFLLISILLLFIDRCTS